MDKNKNRTDLLAAGRKKLQQYRQKKDGKGSKPSGKANKSDHDVVTDEASSVAKSEKGKKQLPATEVPVQDPATEPVDSSIQDSSDNLVATNADTGSPEFSTPSLQIEVSEADENGSSLKLANESIDALVPDKDLQISNLDEAMPTNYSPETVNVGGKPESGYVHVTPVGLKAILDVGFSRKAGAMQEHGHSCLEPDNRTSTIEFAGDMKPLSSILDERAQVNSGDGEEDTKMEYTSSATEQTSEPDGIPAVASVDDNSGDTNTDVYSDSQRFLPISDGVPSSDPAPTIPKEDVVAGFDGDGGITLPSTSGDSEYVSLTDSVLSGGEVTPAGLTQLAKVFQLLGDDEFRFLVAARESVSSGHVKNDDHMMSGSAEFSERLKEQLYINNFEKELVYLQLCEEWDVQKEFDEHRLQWVNEKLVFSASLGDFEEKNKILSEELARCRSELDRVTSEMEKLQMNVSSSKTELDRSSARIEELQAELNRSEHQLLNVSSELVDSRSSLSDLQVKNENLNGSVASLTDEKNKLEHQLLNVSSELVDSKSLLSDLQVKNENMNVSVASLTNERNKLEKEKGDVILENEKLIKELMECNSLLELAQVDNVDAKRNLSHVKEEKTKLEEEKQDYASEKERLLTELAEWKRSVEGLQVANAKLNEVLTSEREDRSKLEEANEHFLYENKKFSSEIMEFKNLVESLRSEIANLSVNLDLVTKERTKLGEEMDHLSSEKEDFLTELTNCKTLMKDLQMEYEKSMNDLKDGALQIEQLSKENATLTSTLDMYEAKMREFDDWKMKSAQRDFQESILVEHNSQHAIEQSNSLEEIFLQHVILDEVLKQYVSAVEAKKGELVVLCEDLRQEGISTKAKNSELTEKLCESESRIRELQVQVDKLHEEEEQMASLSSQLAILHRKLDASIGTVHSSETGVGQNIGTRVATSVDAAVAVIQDLQGKLEDAIKNHNFLSNSHKDMVEKIKDLEGANEQLAYVLHKVFDNLQKLVDDSGPYTEESQDDSPRSGQLDHLEISNYDIFIEQLITILRERAQLESLNRKYNLELLGRIKEMEELHKRCIRPDVIMNLLGDIQSVVTLEDIEIKPDELVSSLESIIHFLINRDRSVEKQVGLLREKLKPKEMELMKLQNQIDNLCFSIVPYEIESHIFKESLRSAMEQLLTLRSEMQLKEAEVHQSEQRVSALREKLHIAVTKGKGLIQHRDSLKQSLTATSSELEKCLHELQLKDAALQETETKLKTYSEAGERMEALESELSYIRNSATALRESFLLKDSVLQRIEEILEDLELPEHFHVRDIIDKIDWLAKSVSENSFPASSWNQKGPIGAGLYPDSGSGAVDGWREDLEPASSSGDELRTNYEELQNKFYGLAEQNEMLEQSLMERNKLVQRWEEILDKINIPPHLRSLEPEDRIKWLGAALMEANGRCDSLQQDIYDLEKVRGSLDAVLEESQRRLVDLEAALQSITNEREQLSANLEVLSEKAALYEIENDKLQNEVGALQLKLDEKRVDEEHIHHVHGEIKRLQDLVKDVLQVPETEDLDSSTSDIQRLEGLLRKLADKYAKHPLSEHVVGDATEEHITETSVLTRGERSAEQSSTQWELNLAALERKLEEAEGDLLRVKDERDRHVETNQSLSHELEVLELKNQEFQKLLVEEEQKSAAVAYEVEALEAKNQEFQKLLVQEEQKFAALTHEVEALEVKNQELQKLLGQEEQKSAAVREKLNVAVRRGKSLVQQRDGMKQNINDLTSEVERLKAELKVRENSLLEYQQKMKDLITSQEVMEDKDSEIRFLKDLMSEADSELQDKRNTLSTILGSLAKIDLGVELRSNDPVEKLQQIEKEWHNLQVAMSSSEQDLKKSKRAAELLLAELNEVQERNEDLLDELSRTTMEISKLSKERDSAEAAKHESFSRLEQLSALHLEERRGQFSELMMLKSALDQLRPGFSKIYNLLNDVLPKDLDYLYNLEASIRSSLESSDTSNVGGQTLNSSRSENKVNVRSELFLDSTTEEHHNDNEIIDLWRFVGSHMQGLMTNVNDLEEKLQSHSKCLHEEVIILSETVETLHREMTSHKYSLESAKEEIAWLESTGKQKETENLVLRKYILKLYETCKSSVLEIEKSKGQLVANDSAGEDLCIEGDILSRETLSVLEERIMNIVNRLLSLVKDFHSIQVESVEVNLKEMKATISSLQKELTEKDIQKDRICVDLVSQIKQAEATATSNLQELESSKAQINDLKGQLESVNLQHNVLEQRVKELESQESILVDLHEKVKSLTNAFTAKEQEAEALLQALDEEEAQMESLTNQITDLERLVQQKDLDLESAEAARGKALKKLSITVNKFDELHHLSETLLSEVDKLQSQLQERDSEISFLRDEITRCTSDSLLALETDKKDLREIQDILTWLDSMISGAETHDLHLEGNKIDQVHEHKEILKKQISSIISELKDLRQMSQSKDDQLHTERSKVEDLMRRRELLESSLREKESRLSMHQNDDDSAQIASVTSEIVEVEPVINKWPPQGTSQVRSLRKVNNEQLAISIDDMDSDDKDKLEDEDDDKAHGFKSLTTSKLVPRFTRPVTDFVDGLWVSCDRALMRQPVLRLSLILYWAVMHALLAVFVV
ncbi:golgin subfamily B member 1 isoform X2 [Cynara cardunculus var. scolymus]|uniref:golgin subfamily B member 1 isoform X2 n=1 Tax=Cynara cardunculus var. scolymus TaxID=59895 RepID=UPI000D6284F3|nr:golgin subfamily B member 1 isoform X2 [Cynara cardunculus var. scolymus]